MAAPMPRVAPVTSTRRGVGRSASGTDGRRPARAIRSTVLVGSSMAPIASTASLRSPLRISLVMRCLRPRARAGRCASSCGLAERYGAGQSTGFQPMRAASVSVHAGLARCGRATAHRSARPAAMMLLTWSASLIAPTAIVAMPASLRTRSANGVWNMRP